MAVRGKRAEKNPQPPAENGDATTEAPAGEVAAEQPDNGNVTLTPEQEFALLCQWKRQFVDSRDKMAEAKSAYDSLKMGHKALGKKIAAECGSDALDKIKRLVALDEDENGEDKLMAEIRLLMYVKQWGNAAIGEQLEIFGDLRPIDDRARQEGRLDGLAGKPFNPKFGQGTNAYHAYQDGFEAGQEILGKGFKPLEKPPEAIGDAEPTYQENA